MTTLAEALQRKFEALGSDHISPICKIKCPSRPACSIPMCTNIIAMDHQEITSIGDPKEIIHIFENVRELDISTNQLRFWSDIFALLEFSPRLQFLNLSYNPLQNSSLFCETGEVSATADSKCESSNNSSSSTSVITFHSEDNCNNVDINLLAEISSSEEDKCDFTSNNLISKSPSLSTSCLSYQLNTLLLNSTRVPWKRVLSLLKYLPNLTTLHAALNDYSCCCGNGDANRTSTLKFPQLAHLYFSENRLGTWRDVCCLGGHFPGLQHLVLLRNPLHTVPKMEKGTVTPFARLEDLNLMETRIGDWESVDALNTWFPALKSLRLGTDIPLLASCDVQTLRFDVIARIPTLTSYNVTPITEEERERAERDFVRRFGQIDEAQRPMRFWELERQHGYVAPFVSVNLSPKRSVRLKIRYGDQEKWHSCCLRQSISRLRHELCGLFGLPAAEARRTRLVYFDAAMVEASGPEEMKHPARLLYTYHPNDGDTLLISPLDAPNR